MFFSVKSQYGDIQARDTSPSAPPLLDRPCPPNLITPLDYTNINFLRAWVYTSQISELPASIREITSPRLCQSILVYLFSKVIVKKKKPRPGLRRPWSLYTSNSTYLVVIYLLMDGSHQLFSKGKLYSLRHTSLSLYSNHINILQFFQEAHT